MTAIDHTHDVTKKNQEITTKKKIVTKTIQGTIFKK